MKVDVIIPTYKPGKKFLNLLNMLAKQTYEINHIIIMNTEEKYFDRFVFENGGIERFSNASVHHLSRKEFDHGGTRKNAVALSDADCFVCMTDDAMPEDEFLIERLVRPIEEGTAQAAYARQCPGKKATAIERYSREFNYPNQSVLKSAEDIDKLGIKTYFCSNVCAAYDRKVYDELGGFVKHTIFNEDMIYAAGLINAGYKIAYVAEARVIHSHQYTNIQQLKRNFDLGVSHAQFPEIFDAVPPNKEGMKLVKGTAKYLKKIGKRSKIIGLYVTSAYKYLGYKLGKNYEHLPDGLVRRLSMNAAYWSKGDVAKIMIDPYAGYGRSKEEDSWNRNINKKGSK